VVWKIPPNQNINCWIRAQQRFPVYNMLFSANRVSDQSYDFAFSPQSVLHSGSETAFTDTSTSLHAADHLERRAPKNVSASFNPQGVLGRVFLNPAGGSTLESVQEVQIGLPIYNASANKLTIPGRVVQHVIPRGATPGSTPVAGGTVPLPNVTVRLKYDRRTETFATIPTVTMNPQTTPALPNPVTGLVNFEINPVPQNWSAVLRFKMWVDGGPLGQGTLQEDTDAWASLDYPLQTPTGKPVVELTASPDVADDKNTSVAKRVLIRVRRNFVPSPPQALDVKLTLNSLSMTSSGYLKPQTPGPGPDLAGTYGTSGSADYYVVGGTGSWTPPTASAPATIQISASALEATVQVITRADNLTEQNIIVCELVNNAGLYAPGVSSREDILIFDGPLWTVQELTGSGVYSSSATAVNGGVPGASGGWTVQPQVVGLAVWSDPLSPPHGVLWAPPDMTTINDMGITYIPHGISHRGAVQTVSKIVGAMGNSAFIADASFAGAFGGNVLPHFPGSSGPSVAYGIDRDGATEVGYSTVGGLKKPMKWSGLAIPVNLAAGLNASSVADGEAFAIDSRGVIVGQTSGFSGDTAIKRPFATGTGGAAIHDTTGRLPTPTDGTGEGAAKALMVSGGKSHAVGWYTVQDSALRRATYWPPDGSGLPSSASIVVNLGTLTRPQQISGTTNWTLTDDGNCEALGINSSRTVVGWSGTSSTASDRRAVLHLFPGGSGKTWIDLNDPHFVRSPNGILRSATAITDSGVIVGEGVFSGSPRAFLLIPRTPGQ